MGDWRRGSQRQHRSGGRGGYYEGGGRGGEYQSPSYWKPPPSSGSRQLPVPKWEKDFCFQVGRIPCRKVVEAKELMPIYKSITQWDNSAGEEAFHNAKARYWAQINCLPCNIPLLDPDMYIDEIDWNCKVDPELIADLEKKPKPPTDDEWKFDQVKSGWDSCLADEPIVPTGWVSAEDHVDNNADTPAATGWGDWDGGKNDTKNCGWDNNAEPPVATGWGDWDCGKNDAKNCGWDNNAEPLVETGWDNWGSGKSGAKNSGRDIGTGWGNWENQSGWVKTDDELRLERWKSDADDYYSETRRDSNKRGGNGGGWQGSRNPNYGYKGGEGYYSGNGNSWRNCRGRRRVVS